MAREYSERPAAARARLKRTENRVKRDVTRAKADLAIIYRKPVEEWDFEELRRGQPRDEEGNFRKKRPSWVTTIVLEEASRRLKSSALTELSVHSGAAIGVMHELMMQGESDSVRFQAAKYILDQTMGMATQRVEVQNNVKFTDMLADVIVNADGEMVHDDAIDLDESEWEEVEGDEGQ
jgi:hypothetical protein